MQKACVGAALCWKILTEGACEMQTLITIRADRVGMCSRQYRRDAYNVVILEETHETARSVLTCIQQAFGSM